uniref:Zf-RVT domain-containing protein n=1 Tax=Globodera pallida TaxID=36090 RepID=A0A183CSH4_GLOPA
MRALSSRRPNSSTGRLDNTEQNAKANDACPHCSARLRHEKFWEQISHHNVADQAQCVRVPTVERQQKYLHKKEIVKEWLRNAKCPNGRCAVDGFGKQIVQRRPRNRSEALQLTRRGDEEELGM